jgi:flagellar protein FlgJ
MRIPAISAQSPGSGSGATELSAAMAIAPSEADSAKMSQAQSGEVARQFEAILVRQILGETMKSLLEHGQAGQVYGYFLTEALADGITKGGGLGIRSIIEAQLRQDGGRPADGDGRGPV